MYSILELYSGIGGMHCAWNDTNIPGKVVAAIDINTVANKVYSHNFTKTKLLNRNIQSLTNNELNNLDINVILMSPPCQPFTRNGNCLDTSDARTISFLHVLSLIPDLHHLQYILLENVKGFETSCTRNEFINTLSKSGFNFQEFLLSPIQIGIPNSRLRYYCIAKKGEFSFESSSELMTSIPGHPDLTPFMLSEILENGSNLKCLPNKFLKRAKILDICYKDSRRSCCFTKAYTHFLEGTGSVFTDKQEAEVEKTFKEADRHCPDSEVYVQTLQWLNLRFFSPLEVARLMSFPEAYKFPSDTTLKQCYRLLGNSINVKVVSWLIQLLIKS